jgi:hypothetical protein
MPDSEPWYRLHGATLVLKGPGGWGTVDIDPYTGFRTNPPANLQG